MDFIHTQIYSIHYKINLFRKEFGGEEGTCGHALFTCYRRWHTAKIIQSALDPKPYIQLHPTLNPKTYIHLNPNPKTLGTLTLKLLEP